jgi:hypothetical protein
MEVLMRLTAFLTLCLALSAAAGAAGQVVQVYHGETVRVRVQGSALTGSVVTITPDSLLVRTLGEGVWLAREDVRQMSVRRIRTQSEQRLRVAAVGGMVGATTGGVAGYFSHRDQSCGNLSFGCVSFSRTEYAMIGAVGGLGAGLLIGAVMGGQMDPGMTWRPVHIDRLTVTATLSPTGPSLTLARRP